MPKICHYWQKRGAKVNSELHYSAFGLAPPAQLRALARVLFYFRNLPTSAKCLQTFVRVSCCHYDSFILTSVIRGWCTKIGIHLLCVRVSFREEFALGKQCEDITSQKVSQASNEFNSAEKMSPFLTKQLCVSMLAGVSETYEAVESWLRLAQCAVTNCSNVQSLIYLELARRMVFLKFQSWFPTDQLVSCTRSYFS